MSSTMNQQKAPPLYTVASLCAPIAGIVAAFIMIAGSRGMLAGIGAVVLAVFGSGLIGTVLAITALVRRERLRWLGIVGLLVNALPSLGLLLAIANQRGSM